MSKKQKKAALIARAKRKPQPEQDEPVKRAKFDFVNGAARTTNGASRLAKERREEIRRQGILAEMHRRNKVGGITDRRFGEDDPTMTPEERAMERFVREKQKAGRKSAIFDLEDDEDEIEELTHMGRPLEAQNNSKEIFDEHADVDSEGENRGKKRRRLSETMDGESETQEEPIPDRPKTRQEIMKEVVARSKLQKYERQKAKEDDDDLRAELDAGLADIYALLRDGKAPSRASKRPEMQMNPDRVALLNGKEREEADNEYNRRLRELALDKRSQPTGRTKTEEEKAEDDARRLRDLEEQRLRRMKGEDIEDSEPEDRGHGDDDFFDDGQPEQSNGIPMQQSRPDLDVEDEDDFIIDEDLIASGSDLEPIESDESSVEDAKEVADGDDQEFVTAQSTEGNGIRASTDPQLQSSLAFTFSCPQSHEELLALTKALPLQDLPTVVQRIRALYHPKLDSANKEKLAKFSTVLVEHIYHLANHKSRPPFSVLESLVRHIHSLAKAHANEVSEAFREQLRDIQKNRPMSLNPGDLLTLTAIGAIYPTSDHFHQVVTPAILSIARYLEHAIPKSIADLAKGTYLGTLCLDYQRLSKRYIPESVNYVLNAISMLAPIKPTEVFGPYPAHESPKSLRIDGFLKASDFGRRIDFWDIEFDPMTSAREAEEVKISLLNTQIALTARMAELWTGKSAYPEIIAPFSKALAHLSEEPCSSNLPSNTKVCQCPVALPSIRAYISQSLVKTILTAVNSDLQYAIHTRKPLALHNHRPLAIKTSIPRFEESYNPDKHYDLDTQRTEASKLKAEHKRERKAAIRELRGDARVTAELQLKEKKARDEAYEKKYRRLVAEIQGEEGHEAKVYEREKKARKRKG